MEMSAAFAYLLIKANAVIADNQTAEMSRAILNHYLKSNEWLIRD